MNKKWFTKKKDPPFKKGKTVGETFKNFAETYYDYGDITPKVVDFFKKKKKKKKKLTKTNDLKGYYPWDKK